MTPLLQILKPLGIDESQVPSILISGLSVNSKTINKGDLFIAIKYNFKKPKIGLGSCIFIHLTKDYKPTAGCIALKRKDFLIMLKLIKRNSKIKIS